MFKRFFVMLALVLSVSVFCSAVAHACADLNLLQQAPCDHDSSQDGPLGKKEKDSCDSVRYGMLSTQALSSQTEMFNLHAILLPEALPVSVSLSDVLSLFSRSQGPPFHGFGVPSYSSHVVLRI